MKANMIMVKVLQYPDKIIPLFSLNLFNDKTSFIHGTGLQKRSFLHVTDVALAFETVLFKGKIGEIYNIGSDEEVTVIDVASKICDIIKPNEKFDDLINFGPDRPFNDQRYYISSEKLKTLGWGQQISFDAGLISTIEWYKTNYNRWVNTGYSCNSLDIESIEYNNMEFVQRYNLLIEKISLALDTTSITYFNEIFHIVKFLEDTQFYSQLDLKALIELYNKFLLLNIK
jgi:hypothetical protein